MPIKKGKLVKLVAKPDWVCSKCYETGEIISDNPWDKNLDLQRKCVNSWCNKTYGEQLEWPTHKSWEKYTKRELLEYKKWLEERGGSRPEVAKKKVKEILEIKYHMKDC